LSANYQSNFPAQLTSQWSTHDYANQPAEHQTNAPAISKPIVPTDSAPVFAAIWQSHFEAIKSTEHEAK
jgi:hypothetical protein